MGTRDPEKNFEEFWTTFHQRYPFFALRNVDWKKQYDTYRPRVTSRTSDTELFDILCQMVDPLNDGHVEIEVGKKRFTAEKKTRFNLEFTEPQIKELFKTSEKTLAANGFGRIEDPGAWLLRYGRSANVGYLRIVELEGVGKRKLADALDRIARDFKDFNGFIVDIRDCPGGEDDIGIAIINRFCDRRRVAYHRKTKIGPGDEDYTALRTWHLEPAGEVQFTGPIVMLTCESVFSGGESFALAMKELPHVTILGDHTNGIFSYTLDKTLPNDWDYCLSYQVYYSADMVCYEGKGVPANIEMFNTKADIENGVDPLIVRALEILRAKAEGTPTA
jgi:carboxyl-terminal processing protease